MQQSASLLRAVAAVFVQRAMKKFARISAVVLLVLSAILGWLAVRYSLWWVVGFGLIAPLWVGLAAAVFAVRFAARRLAPRPLTASETQQLYEFSGKIMEVAERAKTPLPLLAARVALDSVRRRDGHVLQQFIGGSRELAAEFARLRSMF